MPLENLSLIINCSEKLNNNNRSSNVVLLIYGNISDLPDRVVQLENLTAIHERDISDLYDVDKSHDQHLATIDAINSFQTNQISDLESMDAVLEDDMSELRVDLNDIDERVTNVESYSNCK